MYVKINTLEELNKFRFWYLNMHDVDVQTKYLTNYWKYGKNRPYPLPTVVKIKENTLTIDSHQCVDKEGQTWEQYLVESTTGSDYKDWIGMSMKEFLTKKY